MLISEIVGGCATRCRALVRRGSTITSIKSSFHPNTSAQPSTASRSLTVHPIEPSSGSTTSSRKSSLISRFRRKSDQSQSSANNHLSVANKHKRNNSLVVSGGGGRGSLDQIVDVQTSDENDEMAGASEPVGNANDRENGGHSVQTTEPNAYSFGARVSEIETDGFGEDVRQSQVY